MSDKSCRLHPNGICGNRIGSNGCHTMGALAHRIEDCFAACPWPSRQKPSPKQETMLERAGEAYEKHCAWASTGLRAALFAMGINPDAPAPER